MQSNSASDVPLPERRVSVGCYQRLSMVFCVTARDISVFIHSLMHNHLLLTGNFGGYPFSETDID